MKSPGNGLGFLEVTINLDVRDPSRFRRMNRDRRRISRVPLPQIEVRGQTGGNRAYTVPISGWPLSDVADPLLILTLAPFGTNAALRHLT